MHHSSSAYTRKIKRITQMVKGCLGVERIPRGLSGHLPANATLPDRMARSKVESKLCTKSVISFFLTRSESAWQKVSDTMVPKNELQTVTVKV